MTNRSNPLIVFLLQEFAASLCFGMVFTVNLVYQAQVAHLNPFQLVLVGTSLEATCFICQVPTGVLADLYSRRWSVIIGYLLIGAGMVIGGSFPIFVVILMAQVVSGLGYTFLSGALEAWVADELGAAQAGFAYLRGSQVGAVGGLLGIGISTLLANLELNLPIQLGGLGVMALAVLLAVIMPERGFKPAPRESRTSWRDVALTFSNGIRLVHSKPIVTRIFMIALIFGAFSEGYDRLWTPHLLNDFTLPALGTLGPVVWFGIIRAGGAILSMITTEIARRRIDSTNHSQVVRALLLFNSIVVAAVVLLAFAQNFGMAIAALLAVSPSRDTAGPLSIAWLNQSLDPDARATVFSMNAQMDALGQITGGPILGAIATAVSIRVSLAAAALLLVPALWLYARSLGVKLALSKDAPFSG